MRRGLLVVLAGGALLLGACGGSPAAGPETSTPGPASPAASPSGPGVTGDPATSPPGVADGAGHAQLAFQAPLVDGGTFDGSVAGDVVLWFWAPW